MTRYGGVSKLLNAASGATGAPLAAFTREIITTWNNIIQYMAPDLVVKDYDPGDKSTIKYAYLDGYLTKEEAYQELLSKGISEDEDEAYWTVQAWDGGDDYSKYDAINQAIRNGEDIQAQMAELTSHGHTEEQVVSNIKSSVGKWYREGEITKEQASSMLKQYFDMDNKEITSTLNKWNSKIDTGISFTDIKEEFVYGDLTESDAIDMYVRYGGYTKKEAESIVREWTAKKETGTYMYDLEKEFVRGNITDSDAVLRLKKYSGFSKKDAETRIRQWKCEKETGIPYDELSQKYVSGEISDSRAKELRVKYGGCSLEDARKTVLKWKCEKDHGIKYNDLGTAYLSGSITKSNAIDWQMKYGEKDRDEAELAVQAWVWRDKNTKYKDLSDKKIDRFITYCNPSGIDISLYYEAQNHVKDISGDGTPNSVKNQYVDYILSLQLSYAQSHAMWNALKVDSWKDEGTPWA